MLSANKTQFNQESVKKMSLDEFKKAYSGKLKDVESVYFEITGKKKTTFLKKDVEKEDK